MSTIFPTPIPLVGAALCRLHFPGFLFVGAQDSWAPCPRNPPLVAPALRRNLGVAFSWVPHGRGTTLLCPMSARFKPGSAGILFTLSFEGPALGFSRPCSGGSLDPRLSSRYNSTELEGAPPLVFMGGLLRTNATISLLRATSTLSALSFLLGSSSPRLSTFNLQVPMEVVP